MRARELDCTRCGACCHNVNENRELGYEDYIPVRRDDRVFRDKRLARQLTFKGSDGRPHMKLVNQHCIALHGKLGKRALCSIYEVRPRVCRTLEPGSEPCLRYRKERGIDAG